MERLVLSPRAACLLAVFLAVVLVVTILWAAVHGPVRESTQIHPCAAVLVRGEEQHCR